VRPDQGFTGLFMRILIRQKQIAENKKNPYLPVTLKDSQNHEMNATS
jgi:hypothetical protein